MAKIFPFNGLIDKIKEWYHGEYISPPDNAPDSPFVRISPGYYKKPFLAKAFQRIGKFWLNHWQWILGFLITTILLIVAILTLIK